MIGNYKIISRKHFLALLGGLALTGAGFYRLVSYPELVDWRGKILSTRQACVLIAASETLFPFLSEMSQHQQIAHNVDRYLSTCSPSSLGNVGLMLSVIEHGSFLAYYIERFTRLSQAQRERYLNRLTRFRNQLALCYRGLRDLCMVGYYQQGRSWKTIHYPGPLIHSKQKMPDHYAVLLAPAGRSPFSKTP